MTSTHRPAPSPFHLLDRQRFGRFHTLALFTTGMGVFTDGYDLSSIGIVLGLVLHSFGVKHLAGIEASLMTGSALAGAAVGALLFGWLANKGRKRFYGLDVTLLAVAALAQAVVPSVGWLIAVRFVLGLGTGADYVLSPIILGEHANAADRGKSLALGFGLIWGIGASCAALLYLLLHTLGVSPDVIWRVVLAAGALPAASVIYLRRKLPETARYLGRVEGDVDGVRQTARLAGVQDADSLHVQADATPVASYFQRYWRTFLAACALWFLFDIVIYASILFGPSLLARQVHLNPGVFQLLNFLVFTVPGAILGALLTDRIGRKPLQAIGFAGMGLALFGYGLYSASSLTLNAAGALVGIGLFGAFNLLGQAGPGSVSAAGILGVELAPTKVRGWVQGLTVASGRLGATLTAFVFPALIHAEGTAFAMNFLAIVCVLAAALTLVGIPEPSKRSLEEASGELHLAAASQISAAPAA